MPGTATAMANALFDLKVEELGNCLLTYVQFKTVIFDIKDSLQKRRFIRLLSKNIKQLENGFYLRDNYEK